jgi:hypothetical protein
MENLELQNGEYRFVTVYHCNSLPINYPAASSGVSSGVMFHSPQAAGNTTRRDLRDCLRSIVNNEIQIRNFKTKYDNWERVRKAVKDFYK